MLVKLRAKRGAPERTITITLSEDEAIAIFHAVSLASQFDAFVNVVWEDRRDWCNRVYATFSSEHDLLNDAYSRLDAVLYAQAPLPSRLGQVVYKIMKAVKPFRAV